MITPANVKANEKIAGLISKASSDIEQARGLAGSLQPGEPTAPLAKATNSATRRLEQALNGITRLGDKRIDGNVQLGIDNSARRHASRALRALQGTGGAHIGSVADRIARLNADSPDASMRLLSGQLQDAATGARLASEAAERSLQNLRPREIEQPIPSNNSSSSSSASTPTHDEFTGEPYPPMIGQPRDNGPRDAFTGEPMPAEFGGSINSGGSDPFTGESTGGLFLG